MSDQMTEQRNAWMERVLGVRIAAAPAPGGTVELSKRFSALATKARLPGAPANLLEELRKGAAALKSGAVAQAQGLLQELEAAVARAGQAAAGVVQGAPARSPQAMADAVKPRQRLRAASSAIELAASNLEMACRAMLRTPAFEGDPQAQDAAVQAAVDAIGSRVPDFAPVSATVQAALTKLGKLKGASAADLAKLAAPALAAIGSYRQAVDAEPLLREMEDTEAGTYAIHGAITKALDELTAALGG